MRQASLPIALAVLALAGAARAATPDAAQKLNFDQPAADAQALNAAVLAPDRQAHDRPPPGVAKTSIESRFEKGASGAIGFLCGRPDSLDERASSQPLGSDPQGRFLGARLSFAFR